VRIFSYRNKRKLRQFLIILAVLFVILAAFCAIRFIYLQRFLVYENGTVKLDYAQDLIKEQQSSPHWDRSDIEIITEEAVQVEIDFSDKPLKRLSGLYITTQMLLDMDAVSAALGELEEEPDAVMLDLKSIYGNFYYSSGLHGAQTSSADIGAIDAMIDSFAARSDLYLIARIASLSDTNFALANQSCGLPLRSGALWMDNEGCYWLDPMKQPVQEYLVAIAQELAAMGFDEVVFDDFRIPDSQNIIYSSELTREDAAVEAAAALKDLLSADGIRVSFNSSNAGVAEASDRVFLVTDNGSAVAELVSGLQDSVEDPAAQIVFLTASRDTRFEGYGILRPLIEGEKE